MSLIEIVATLALTTFFLLLFTPRPKLITKTLLQSEIKMLAATFYFLQQKAIATGKKHFFYFSSYRLPKSLSFISITFPETIVFFSPSGHISPGAAYLSSTRENRTWAITVGVAHTSCVRIRKITKNI